jgi:hypothetical protein
MFSDLTHGPTAFTGKPKRDRRTRLLILMSCAVVKLRAQHSQSAVALQVTYGGFQMLKQGTLPLSSSIQPQIED